MTPTDRIAEIEARLAVFDTSKMYADLRWLLDQLKQAHSCIQAFVESPPAQMSWRHGLLPINADGMREVIDAEAAAVRQLKAYQQCAAELAEPLEHAIYYGCKCGFCHDCKGEAALDSYRKLTNQKSL